MPPSTALSVIICEDDPIVRSVISDVIEGAHHTVLAETDSSSYAVMMIDQFDPDVVIVDLDLAQGSGVDVIERCQEREDSPTVIVFTAFAEAVPVRASNIHVVRKPDVGELERTLLGVEQREEVEERRAASDIGHPTRPDDAAVLDTIADFSRALLDADPSDVLIAVFVDGLDEEEAARHLREALRRHDWLTRRHTTLIALLTGDEDAATRRLTYQLAEVIPDIAERIDSGRIGDDPTERFLSLTQR